MKEITDRLPDWEFDLVCARIKPGLSDQEKIGRVTVHRCGFGKPIDKYLLPVWGVYRAFRLSDSKQAIIWSLMASYNGFAALVYTWLRPRTKFLLTLQEGDPLEYIMKRVGRFGWMFHRIFQRADAVQAISTFLADWSVRMGFRGTPRVIPNGVDIERFAKRISPEDRKQWRDQWGCTDKDIVLVSASRLVVKNGMEDLVNALKHLADAYKVVIAGEGDRKQAIEEIVRQHGWEKRVILLGTRSHVELPGILQAGDIFIRPSLSEGLGNSFLEAMVTGLPVVATPVGGIPDFLTDGKTGVYCQPQDPASIAQAVLRIQQTPALRAQLIQEGEAMVRSTYHWEAIAHAIDEMLDTLWKARSSNK